MPPLPIGSKSGTVSPALSGYIAETAPGSSSPCMYERPRQPSMRGRLCPFLTQTGSCKNMRDCVYSHTVEQARGHNQHFKTKICDFAANGFCKRSTHCRFAHSYSELGPATSSDSCGDSTPEPSYFVRAAASRNISSVSTEPDVTGSQSPVQGSSPVHSSIGSSSVPEDSSESVQREYRQSPMPRVCYEAPAKQRTAFRHRPRAATPSAPAFVVPSSFHYVAQMEKRKYYEHSQAPLLPTPMTPHPMMAYQHAGGAQMMFQPVAYPYGPHGATALVYTPIMYHNMGGAPNNVVYED